MKKLVLFGLIFGLCVMGGARNVFGQSVNEVVGPYNSNWYLGGREMSCNQVCTGKGLMCSGTSWNDENDCRNEKGLLAMFGKVCNTCQASTYLQAPFVAENTVVNVNACYYRNVSGRPNADCTRIPTGNHRRLCQCTSSYSYDAKIEFDGLNASVGVGRAFDVKMKVTNVGTTQTVGNIVIKLFRNDVEITTNTFGIGLAPGASYVFTRTGEKVDSVGTVRYKAEISLAGDADISNNTVSRTVVVVAWGSPTPTPGGCSLTYGDTNGNGVDIQDGFVWYQAYKAYKENSDNYNVKADFDCDRDVDIQDGYIWYRYWKNPNLRPTNTTIPLPTTISCGTGILCSDVGAQWCCQSGEVCGQYYPDCGPGPTAGTTVTVVPTATKTPTPRPPTPSPTSGPTATPVPPDCIMFGDSCLSDSQCCSGFCDTSSLPWECANPSGCFVDGDDCSSNTDCCSGFCDATWRCRVPIAPTQTALPPPP